MKTYTLTGRAKRKGGGTYPFHKTVGARNRTEAEQAVVDHFSAKNDTVEQMHFKQPRTAPPSNPEEKFCPYHQTNHPVDEFGIERKSPDGRARTCKAARREIAERKRQGEDPESLLTRPRDNASQGAIVTPRRINLDGEAYVHLGDLISILRRPR